MNKFTKIVATIGPVTETEEVLEQLAIAGMNVARFNTKHSDPEWHNERLRRVKTVAKKLGQPIATLLDLQGPEIRIVLPEEKPFPVKRGDAVTFTSDEKHDAKHFALVPQVVIESLSIGDQVLLEDGACEFTVVEKAGSYIMAQAMMACEVKHRKTMNTPGVVLDMPSLTERDYLYLDGVDPKIIDYVGLSFVRNARDIAILREELAKRKIDADVIAKIENQEAVDNLDEIIAAADAVMVARGDLGVEVPFQELAYWQKNIIIKCRDAAKPVITATQMLKSMVNDPRPSRAEVSDVANAIYDGTDAVMLSDETTIGEYPVKAVQTQAIIAEFNEEYAILADPDYSGDETKIDLSISYAAVGILDNNLEIDKIVCLTETGRTARLLSRFRLPVPIYAITSSEKTKSRLALDYGVEPFVVKLKNDNLRDDTNLINQLKEEGIINKDETIILIHGNNWKEAGMTNSISLVTI